MKLATMLALTPHFASLMSAIRSPWVGGGGVWSMQAMMSSAIADCPLPAEADLCEVGKLADHTLVGLLEGIEVSQGSKREPRLLYLLFRINSSGRPYRRTIASNA